MPLEPGLLRTLDRGRRRGHQSGEGLNEMPSRWPLGEKSSAVGSRMWGDERQWKHVEIERSRNNSLGSCGFVVVWETSMGFW